MTEKLIKIHRLNKTFHDKSGHNPLVNLDLSVNSGEFIAIVGKSGTGKSTLLNIIGLLDKQFTGEYYFKKQNIANLSDIDIAKIRNVNIGFVFQSYNLLPEYTVAENILLPNLYSNNDIDHHYLDELLKTVNLLDKKHNYPKTLSGGQQQRAAIARALIHKPQIIIADEPTDALDSETSESILKLLSNLNKLGNTILLVTHDNDIADYADKKYALVDGKLNQL